MISQVNSNPFFDYFAAMIWEHLVGEAKKQALLLRFNDPLPESDYDNLLRNISSVSRGTVTEIAN